MRGKGNVDGVGRQQPSKYMRKKRALKAARYRWKEKRVLVPGVSLHWSQSSFANKSRHLAAVKKGGAATGGQIREQQRVFWRWYYGDCKAQLHGPFRAVVETFERIEAAFAQRYGQNPDKDEAWDGFEAVVFRRYILTSCRRMKPEVIERDMWQLYKTFMEADPQALYGNGRRPGLLSALREYEAAKEEKELRLAMYRSRSTRAAASNIKKKS